MTQQMESIADFAKQAIAPFTKEKGKGIMQAKSIGWHMIDWNFITFEPVLFIIIANDWPTKHHNSYSHRPCSVGCHIFCIWQQTPVQGHSGLKIGTWGWFCNADIHLSQ